VLSVLVRGSCADPASTAILAARSLPDVSAAGLGREKMNARGFPESKLEVDRTGPAFNGRKQ
jgi:hypothetical protein